MVLILDGSSEIGAHVRSNLGHIICLRHLFRSRTVTNRTIFFLGKDLFSVISAQHVLSYHCHYYLQGCLSAINNIYIANMVLVVDGNSEHVAHV